ncbi:MAG: DUF998 domain-containing protein [Euryarchaeota archaeon]|nr:DUF998 domain-containing protein [Euryarchaeota archaeon]
MRRVCVVGLMGFARNPGLYLLLGSLQFALLLMIAEMLRPGYSVSLNYISDLGVGPEPSRTIFNGTLILFGLFGLAASWFFWSQKGRKVFIAALAISSVGTIGVGLFPEDTGVPHALFALIAFFFGALTAILSFLIVRPPYSWFGAGLGGLSMAALALFITGSYLGLGPGGMERLILYPSLLWYIGFSGHLLGLEKNTDVVT